jgi:glycosyltransferase involved in cell wall biosynthesis
MPARILWVSSGPWIGTGYGVQTRYIVKALKESGFDIMLFTYHLGGGPINYDGYIVLPAPAGVTTFATQPIISWYKKTNRNLVITLLDVWVLPNLGNEVNWVPYTPVDAPLDEYTLEINQPLQTAKAIITFSKFGKQQVEKVVKDKKVYMIYHGIDTKLFTPIESEEEKKKLRRMLGLPQDAFIFGFVGVNESDRKDIPGLLKAFSLFLANNRDAKDVTLIVWSGTKPQPGKSYDLVRLARRYGIEDKVMFPTDPDYNMVYTYDFMPNIYRVMDWYVTASSGEGFGLPIAEAMACGVPVIAPNNSAQTELVTDPPHTPRGILVNPAWVRPTLWTPTHQEYSFVDPHDLAEAMAKAYNIGNDETYKKNARAFVEEVLSWDKIIPQWIDTIHDIENELKL